MQWRFLEMELSMPPLYGGSNTSDTFISDANFDTNMVIILAALLCALICVLGLNFIAHRISVAVYGAADESTIPTTKCPICLDECNHGFHVRCINMWLLSHSSCPNCRHSLLEKPTVASESGSGQLSEVVVMVERSGHGQSRRTFDIPLRH
ncbi:RING-H2 finger protein ATL73 [Glycine max]|nr:RING-H2 finger protein ATL73 [Glycine max]